MNPNAQFERDLEEWLEAEAPARAPAGFHATVMDRARTLRQRPGWTTKPMARRFGRGRGITLLAAAALLLVGGALAAGSGLLRRPAVVPPVPAPSLAAVVAPSPDAPSPSPSDLDRPSASPIRAAGPIVWTEAGLKQDWPAPVRTESAGVPILVPIHYKFQQLGACPGPNCAYKEEGGHFADPTGDTGSDAVPWGDIKDVSEEPVDVNIHFVSGPKEGVDPRTLWYASGIVVDDDGDGVPDWRYGIDNVPAGTPSHCDGPGYTTRRWRTDLHTGRTDWMVCYGLVGPAPDGVPDPVNQHEIFESAIAFDSVNEALSFSQDTTAGIAGAPMPKRFYAWASVIQDGRIVATDYAPDAGWLVPSPNAKP